MWSSFAFAATVGGPFSSVEVDVPCAIELTRGDQASVELAFEPVDGGRAWATIENGVLGVHGEGSFESCLVKGTHVGLVRLAAAGAAQLQIDRLDDGAEIMGLGASSIVVGWVHANRLKVDLAGGSSLTVREGRVGAQRARVTGASSLQAERVKCDQVEVTVAAASAAEVWATHKLEARVTGASAVRIHGEPTQRQVSADRTSTVEEL